MKVRVSWAGAGSSGYSRIAILGLLVACVWLALFTLTKPAEVTNEETAVSSLEMEKIDSAGLAVTEVNLGGKVLRMTYSELDIGQPPDVFDNNTETLMRGRADNPFVLDFDFSEPQAITGVMLDFGRMDFDMRVEVYGADGGKPVLYSGEYRDQPPEPHVDMEFVNGPALVKRIYIEIEQYNPPEEPHIHIREVLFKE
jgi:hypothetical protein